MTRRFALGVVAWIAFAVAGCDSIIDAPEFTDARIEVDPTIVRTIHYAPVNGVERESEVTTKRIDEIECLRAAPWCDLSEGIQVTVHNAGSRAIYLENREYVLERFAQDTWHRVHTGYAITLHWTPPAPIQPNESGTLPISVLRIRPGLYRLGVLLWAIVPTGPPYDYEVRTSGAFYVHRLPDYRPFQCPSVDLAGSAEGIARARMQQALAAGPNPGHHDWMLQIENRFPGFGGAYMVGGTPNVFLKDESNLAGVSDWARSVWGRTPRIHKGNFSFSELLGWQEAMQREFLFELVRNGAGLPELRTFGIDEETNRLRIVISTELARADAECLARGVGMPEGMAHIVEGMW